jgi:hypothetical protein
MYNEKPTRKSKLLASQQEEKDSLEGSNKSGKVTESWLGFPKKESV